MAWYSMESSAEGTAVPPESVNLLTAIQRGSLFPKEPFNCKIHSLFAHAVNLEIPDFPLLYTLVNQEFLMHPLAALISNSGYTSFESLKLQTGQSGCFDGMSLTLGPTCRISFPKVRTARACDERVPDLNLSHGEFQDQLDLAGQALEYAQTQKDTELRWNSAKRQPYYRLSGSKQNWASFSEAVNNLVLALHKEKISEALTATLQLVGMGQGLTPSGDDFLCGFILALCMGHTEPLVLDTWLWGLANELGVGELPAKTTKELTSRVSKTFLYLATRKRFSKLLLQMGRSYSKDPASWMSFLSLLETYGHSSGLDSATGFLYGMATVDKRRN